MIELQWRTCLDGAETSEVTDLLTAARADDAEAGFSSIDPVAVRRTEATDSATHLLVRLQGSSSVGSDDGRLAAYMRLTAGDDDTSDEGQLIVHPDLRSRGIATSIFEQIGLDPSRWDLPPGRRVRTWAFGSHPAVGRMSTRLDAAPIRQLWTVVRHLRGPFAEPLPSPVLGELAIDAVVAAAGAGWDTAEASALAPAERAALVAAAARPDGLLVVARGTDGTMAGVAVVDATAHQLGDRRQASIRALVVVPEARRRGIGSALLATALVTVHAHGAEVATMLVDPLQAGVVPLARRAAMELEDVHHCFEIADPGADPDSVAPIR